MNNLFFIPAALGLAITLAIWTALRLTLWARTPQNISVASIPSSWISKSHSLRADRE